MMMKTALFLLAGAAALAGAETPRMEIQVERRAGNTWHLVDPGLVLEQNDSVRFRFRTNFNGFLYVTNHSTSGKTEQLFPRQETGRDNRVVAGREYTVPATSAAFRITGPAGHEVVYWLVSPVEIGAPGVPAVPPANRVPPRLMPRCDDTLMRARGNCIDTSAGVRLTPRGEGQDLMLLRKKDTTVISSPVPLTGPVVYEFHLAHR